ncbi:MAG: hypothetical protein F6K00_34495 [Leptolyngbya sp. SIOISBB]|nr:hypothetical protein [Leptolyngbya sp. SIOISBB]
MATPTSYLQTLSSAEASAFIASLQKVQAHLQKELAWMNQQVQQKTVQLQGIETLLTEASMLGHLETNTDMVAAPDTPDVQTTPEPTMEPAAAETAAPPQAEPAGTNDVEADVDASEGVPAQESASSPAEIAAPPATAQGKKTASKPSAKAKSPKSSSVKATTKKQPSTKTQSRSKARKTRAQPKSRALLRPEFADTSLTDAVTQVLTQAAEPLHLDQLVSELYEDISGEDLKRIKKALANVLSEGKKTGKWRNVGNGVYQIQA